MRYKAMALLCWVMLSALLAGTAAAATVATAQSESLDTSIRRHMADAGIMGIGAAIIVDGKRVWSKGYGWADKAQQRAFTPDTVMNIGSISKTVTGMAMMRAVQDGKLSLDVDINAYLPFEIRNPFHPNAVITLRQLATHTASLTDRWTVYQDTYYYNGDEPEVLADFLRSYFAPEGAHYATENFLNYLPGTHREYSNIGAALAGYIVERAVGESLNSYTRRHFFEPLQMQNSSWLLSEIGANRHATLYIAQNGLTTPIPLYRSTTYPDGGLRTSVSDLSKLFITLLNGGSYNGTRILDQALVTEMLRFQYTEANKPANVDLREDNAGLFWSTKFNVTRIGHGGSDPGLKTEMLASLDKDVGLVLFSNTSLSGEAMRHYVAIFRELWQYAESLKANRDSKAP